MTPHTWKRWGLYGSSVYAVWTSKWHIQDPTTDDRPKTYCGIRVIYTMMEWDKAVIVPGEKPPPEQSQCKNCLKRLPTPEATDA